MSALCKAVPLSRQAYYQGRRQRRRKEFKGGVILEAVRKERLRQPRLGTRKLQVLLRQAGIEVGRDTLLGLLKEKDLLVAPKKKSARTTYHDPYLPVHRNLLYEFEHTQPHQVLVSDVTYIDTDEGYMYLSLVTDLHSRRIVGWNAALTNTSKEAIKALVMAMQQLPANCYPIHHSDRGSQYCSHEYIAALAERKLPISMTEKNHCYENCYAERVNGILKDEFNLDRKFRTREQAKLAIAQAVHVYNTLRPHTSLQYRTPDQVHQITA